MSRFFRASARNRHAPPQHHSSTRDVSVMPALREGQAYVVDRGAADPLPVHPDPERDAMAERIRAHLKQLHPERSPTSKASE